MPVSRVLPPSILSKSNNDKRTALAEYDVSKTIVDGSKTSTEKHSTLTLLGTALQTTALNSPEAPRALNRKTKQSDYALWVGNLPRRANVVDLKDHFSQDATNEIQSIYLIYASKCAFVNYRSATALAAALAKFQGSVYRGMRLVCRVRKEFTTLRSDHRAVASPSQQRDETMDAFDDDKSSMPKAMTSLCKNGVQSMDRYFIIKSLAVKYLEISKESGIWAAQRHNEFHLNQAFKTAEHVYLIFSANKSGEYFGYARMMSPINDEEEPAVKISRWPKPSTGDLDDLAVMTTVATSTAPKGRIIDNSTRGTTFWEADPLEKNEEVDSEKSVTDEEEAEAQVLSRPFRIQWLSNERVPFHNTRNLHNPWNANRKVKVARDGTEIEPSIGRKLVQLFHPM
ncbi:Nucleotide-binding alpha-beta plait [Penicillium atrosanguineum]|uniref:Nucleotide-binding alpha-beta plait n=1 Tax=Penicillium atrosanguineum TaxID=1132637 RepID=A0A9W9PYS4_9EURO|nr:Nucleotide-binding alpha-beta plait [Penicillium atrosanguineum]KAJ5318422.1 Nucleotide-binding alpha-beta plait [Penicillium atrosanguineum]